MKRRLMAAVALALCILVLIAMGGCAKKEDPAQTTPLPVVADAQPDADMRQTVLYYQDASGYIVPVMKLIPWEEGIAKAALSDLIAGSEDDAILSAMGLSCTLPQSTAFELDIANGVATADIELPAALPDGQAEQALISSVVNSLLEFPTVQSVRLRFDGKEVASLKNGTKVLAEYTSPLANVEPAGAPEGTQGKLELYFANDAQTMIVPVLRVVEDNTTLSGAIGELFNPKKDKGLVSLMPDGCELLGAQISQDGVAIVNFSKGFAAIADTPAGEARTLAAVERLCKQFTGVEEVQILIEGKPYEATQATMATLQSGYLNVFDR